MENNQSRLGGYFRNNTTPGQDIGRRRIPDFNTFLTLYSLNLTNTFRDLDIDMIETERVVDIARASLVFSSVATDVWGEVCEKRTSRRVA